MVSILEQQKKQLKENLEKQMTHNNLLKNDIYKTTTDIQRHEYQILTEIEK